MKMIEKYKPDFEKSYAAANNILVSSDVLTMFPFKTKDILKMEDNIICCSYKKAKKYNVNIEDFGSKSAVLIKQGDNKIIFYNEEELIARIRFSILHEYGHYKLQHDLDTKDEEMYKKFEVETNYFAAQLLSEQERYFDDLIIQKYKNWLDSKVPPLNSFNMFFDEYERQQERERWMYK